jgi:hypothetical protein
MEALEPPPASSISGLHHAAEMAHGAVKDVTE